MLKTFCGTLVTVSACLMGLATEARAADEKPVVIMDTSAGPVTIELDPKNSPITVENFLKYVDEGYYDNLIFHRVIPGFMIQGGGMDDKLNEKGKQRGGIRNESNNGLSNRRGTVTMARTSDPNSATSQFFINLVDNSRLDGSADAPGYAVFGKVIGGMENVDTIARSQTRRVGINEGVPVKPIYIKSIKRK